MSRILTIADTVSLGTICEAAQGTRKVARLAEDGEVVYGIARSIGTVHGGFIAGDEDVRDAFLRVTTQSGFEVFWPIAELMPEVQSGEFAIYDWS